MSYLARQQRLPVSELVKQFWNIPAGAKEQLAKYYIRMWTGKYLRSVIYPASDNDGHCIEHDGVEYQVIWLTPALESINSKYVGLSFRASVRYGNYVLVKAWHASKDK